MSPDRKEQIGDFVICIAVFIQPVLVLLQHVLIDVFRMDSDATTNYRVVLTAIPMLSAIALGFYRRTLRFVVVYFIAAIVLLLTVLFFPKNEKYIRYEGLRFLLPLIIPTVVCFTVVNSKKMVRKALDIMAWVSSLLVVFYAWSFFTGRFSIDSYNMSFSYGCLLPMIVLYSQRRLIPTILSIFLFFVVVAIGSRGGAIIFVAYVIIDAVLNWRKGRWYVLISGGILVLLIPSFLAILGRFDIGSRTLRLLNSGDITYDAGREEIYSTCTRALADNPLFGVGLFGDRVLLDGAYCHNFFLEIGLDFGLILGGMVLLFLIWCFIRSFRRSKGEDKDLLLIITFGCFLPFMVSGSYLISNNVALWMGLLLLLNRRKSAISNL